MEAAFPALDNPRATTAPSSQEPRIMKPSIHTRRIAREIGKPLIPAPIDPDSGGIPESGMI
jgi:hypothetical protein